MSSSEKAEWETIANCTSGLEADIARVALEAEGIPVMVRSDGAGIFGLAYQGTVPGGVKLQVPSPEAARAREILSYEDPRAHLSLLDDDDDAT